MLGIDNTLYKDGSRPLIIRCRIHIYFISLAPVICRIILDNIVHIEKKKKKDSIASFRL